MSHNTARHPSVNQKRSKIPVPTLFETGEPIIRQPSSARPAPTPHVTPKQASPTAGQCRELINTSTAGASGKYEGVPVGPYLKFHTEWMQSPEGKRFAELMAEDFAENDREESEPESHPVEVEPFSKWTQTLKAGEEGEQIVRSIFERAGYETAKVLDDVRVSPILVSLPKVRKQMIVEVKNEERYAYTGNFIVEFYQGSFRVKSGMLISGADIWIHLLQSKCVVYDRAFMFKLMTYLVAAHKLELGIYGASDNKSGGAKRPWRRFLTYPWFDHCSTNELPESFIVKNWFNGLSYPPLKLPKTIRTDGWEQYQITNYTYAPEGN